MKCRRAFDADLAAVLRGETDDADFVTHYPACSDCAAEVQVWRELEGMLRAEAQAGDAHPEPATLLALVDAPGQLPIDERRAVERHLTACRVCTDEVRALGGAAAAVLADVATSPVGPRAMAAAPSASAASAPVAAAPASSAPTVPIPDPTSAGGWLGRIVWHPAFAYALVAVLLVPLLRDQLGRLAVPARVMDARHQETRQEARQAPAGARPAPASVASEPAASAPAPPPAQSGDAEKANANSSHGAELADGADRGRGLASAKRKTSEPGGAAVPPRDLDAGVRKDVAPAAEKRAPAQPEAPEMDGKLGRHTRERQPGLAAAAEPKAADELAVQRPGAMDLPLSFGRAGAERAAAPEAGGAAPAGPPTVELRSGTPGSLAFALVESGVLLRVVPSADLAAGVLDLHVRSRVGGHELATRVAYHAGAIVVRIPPRWLAPGDYVVTLTPVQEGAGGNASVAALLGFTVRTPTGAEAGR